MADISKTRVDNVEYDIKDAVARGYIGDLSSLSTEEKSNLVAALNEVAAAAASAAGGACGITYIESTDTDNPVSIRDLASGTYVFYGKFKPFSGSTNTITFSSKLLVNVVKQSSASHVMVFYPVNNCVQYLKATDDTYERKNVYLNDLMTAVDTLETSVGDITALATTDKTSLVAAINELAASAGSGSGSPIDSISATVGQIAKVKTVDESGKPTEWEAVDMPSGGGSDLPAYTEADYGKVLSCTADGLVWVAQSGGGSGDVPSAEGVEF